jgi:hypothetical protein
MATLSENKGNHLDASKKSFHMQLLVTKFLIAHRVDRGTQN